MSLESGKTSRFDDANSLWPGCCRLQVECLDRRCEAAAGRSHTSASAKARRSAERRPLMLSLSLSGLSNERNPLALACKLCHTKSAVVKLRGDKLALKWGATFDAALSSGVERP